MNCVCYVPGDGSNPMAESEFQPELLAEVRALLMRQGIGKVILEHSGDVVELAGTRYIFTPESREVVEWNDRRRKIRQASDFYKEVFGSRPDCETDEECLLAYELAKAEMDKRKSTPAGRNALREQGWKLDGGPDFGYREPETEVV